MTLSWIKTSTPTQQQQQQQLNKQKSITASYNNCRFIRSSTKVTLIESNRLLAKLAGSPGWLLHSNWRVAPYIQK